MRTSPIVVVCLYPQQITVMYAGECDMSARLSWLRSRLQIGQTAVRLKVVAQLDSTCDFAEVERADRGGLTQAT